MRDIPRIPGDLEGKLALTAVILESLMTDPGDIDTLDPRYDEANADNRCPKCGDELHRRTIHGKYIELECLGCAWSINNAPPEKHFG